MIKVPQFFFSQITMDEMLGKVRKSRALVLDLRGNPGGSIESLKLLLGGVFNKEVKIGDLVGRKQQKPVVAKPLHDPFAGKLFVLVDSDSASAAELFAHVVQLEKRGIVLGDRTAGSVMEGLHYQHQLGDSTVIFYGASITEADLIMTDGKSLENTGVTPDDPMLPVAGDLASGRDPVLAHAAELAGVKLTPEEAGAIFPYEWSRE